MGGWLNQMQVNRWAKRPGAPTGAYPGVGYHSTAASSALQRWLNQQKESRKQFTAAEEPLRQAVTSFQPGGGYGRGQKTLLRDEARRAGAEATAQQVASGMSSGSLATGTGLRVKRDLATSLAGVEDQRTQFLNQALSQLSGLRGQQAGLTTQVNDPTYAPWMATQASMFGAEMGGATSRAVASGQQATQRQIARIRQQTELAKLNTGKTQPMQGSRY